MSEYLPKEVRQGLDAARAAGRTSPSRMRIEAGGKTFTVLRYWEGGFALDPMEAVHLRGLVDVYDGARHVSNCLVVASEEQAGELVFEYKRVTAHADAPPRDYEIAEGAPVALIDKV